MVNIFSLHKFRRPVSSIQVRCNRLQSQPYPRPPSISISAISYHSLGSPLFILDQEAREHKLCQCLLHCGRLTRQSLGVRDSGGRLRAIWRIQVRNWKESSRGERKEEASSLLPRRPDEYCLGRCDVDTLQERGSSAVGGDCVSINHQRRSRRLLIPSLSPL
jgi:hypothetical protein